MAKSVVERARPFSTAIFVIVTTLLVLWVTRGSVLRSDKSDPKQVAYSELAAASEPVGSLRAKPSDQYLECYSSLRTSVQ